MNDAEISIERLKNWLNRKVNEKSVYSDTTKAFIGDITMVLLLAEAYMREHDEKVKVPQ